MCVRKVYLCNLPSLLSFRHDRETVLALLITMETREVKFNNDAKKCY